MKQEKSNCCSAPITTLGNTTKYYICTECKEPCDREEKTKESSISKKRIQFGIFYLILLLIVLCITSLAYLQLCWYNIISKTMSHLHKKNTRNSPSPKKEVTRVVVSGYCENFETLDEFEKQFDGEIISSTIRLRR